MDKRKLFEEFIDVLNEVYLVTNDYHKTCRNYGTNDKLYMKEVHVLEMIGDDVNVTSTEISKKMRNTKGAVAQIITKLEKKGLIIKEVREDDTRKIRLVLTDKGKKVYNAHKEIDKKTYSEYYDKIVGFSEQDIMRSIDLIKIMMNL